MPRNHQKNLDSAQNVLAFVQVLIDEAKEIVDAEGYTAMVDTEVFPSKECIITFLSTISAYACDSKRLDERTRALNAALQHSDIRRLWREAQAIFDLIVEEFELPKAEGTADEVAADKLWRYIENDAELYRTMYTPIIKSLMLKQAKLVDDPALTERAFLYLVDAGAQKYAKEVGGGNTPWHVLFPIATRQKVAANIARSFEIEADLCNYNNLLPAKYQPDSATFEFSVAKATPQAIYDKFVWLRQTHGKALAGHVIGNTCRWLEASGSSNMAKMAEVCKVLTEVSIRITKLDDLVAFYKQKSESFAASGDVLYDKDSELWGLYNADTGMYDWYAAPVSEGDVFEKIVSIPASGYPAQGTAFVPSKKSIVRIDVNSVNLSKLANKDTRYVE